MLRIESYITPLILSYVDKYIKNLKPEDSQVSLWGGDAVFHNLDLRLDVLEEELKLPFSFVNGHIHELRIHVPWTKLTSEPIVITINTIECILNLKEKESGEFESSSQSSNSGSKNYELRKRVKRPSTVEAPTSYVQALINRLINNVSIVCNNVILKYVEDDIVLSINVKTLELQSVDQKWVPNFIDMSSEDLTLRNLVSLTDLTVCLDKRNASGKIENYQEPLLYRCSLSCRIIREFETAYAHQPISTRYDVFCPQLHFSLSDTQLPMFLRLVQLALALYYGRLRYQPPKSKTEEVSIDLSPDNEMDKDENDDDDSWTSWAWSVGTTLLPIYWEESGSDEMALNKFRINQTIHMGLYIETATWVFKLTESVQESTYFGPTKMRFTPFLQFEHQGSYITIVVKGLQAANVQMGISSFIIQPIGHCICGIGDGMKASVENSEIDKMCSKHPFLQAGRESQEYLSMSLFDNMVLMGARELWNYHYIFESHISSFTESNLIERTSCFGLDYIYVLELPEDSISDHLSEISNMETSNISEKVLCRCVFGLCEINVNSGFYHRLLAIGYALNQFDYPPYSQDDEVSDKEPFTIRNPEEEDVTFLDESTPLRTYSIAILESSVAIDFAQHPSIDMSVIFNAKRRKKNRRVTREYCFARILPVPSLTLRTSKVDISYVLPMYPRRLVRTACLLRSPSSKMILNCHYHIAMKVHNMSLSLTSEDGYSIPLVQGFYPSFRYKQLVMPDFWTSDSQPIYEYFFDADNFNASFSLPQILLFNNIISSWMLEVPSPEHLKTDSLVDDAIKNAEKYLILCLKMNCISVKWSVSSQLDAALLTLGGISLALCQSNLDILCLLLSAPENLTGLEVLLPETLSVSEKFLKCCFQNPNEASCDTVPTVMTLRLLKMSILFDPLFMSWLKYTPRSNVSNLNTFKIYFKKISEVRLNPKKSCQSSDYEMDTNKVESSSTTLSESKTLSRFSFSLFSGTKPKKVDPVSINAKQKFATIYPILSKLLIHIDVSSSTIFFTTQPLSISSQSGLVDAIHRIYLTRNENFNLGDTIVLCLPRILLQNSTLKQTLLGMVEDVPFVLPTSFGSSGKDRFPWSLSLDNFNIYSLQGNGTNVKLPLLKTVNTTATFAVTTKHQGPILSQVGMVIHLDMSPLDVNICQRQVETLVTIFENIYGTIYISLIALFGPHSQFITDITPNPVEINDQKLKSTKQRNISGQSVLNPSHLPEVKEGAESLNISAFQPQKDSSHPATSIQATTENEEDHGSLNTEIEKATQKIVVTTWVQLTVTRVSATLYSQWQTLLTQRNSISKSVDLSVDLIGEMPKTMSDIYKDAPVLFKELQKLCFVVEDLTASIDLHHVYSKLKCQIANFHIMHYKNEAGGWLPGKGVLISPGEQLTKDLRIIIPGSEMDENKVNLNENPGPFPEPPKSHGFLNMTLTTAQCKNIHTRWNQMVRKHLSEDAIVKECNTPQYLSEIDINVQSLDFIINPIMLKPFALIYAPLLRLQKLRPKTTTSIESEVNLPFGLCINNRSLPLLYLQTDSIRIFLPHDIAKGDHFDHDVMLLKIDSILVTPQVDNPLSRIIIRSDIFQAAEQSRILGVPGSEVEDRQYQIDWLGLSISTGKWEDLFLTESRKPRSISVETLGVFGGENPALEWNNYDPSIGNVYTHAIFHPLMSKVDIRIIFGPAVVYASSSLKIEDLILVAGHSLEFNVRTPIDLHCSLKQIDLFKGIINSLLDIATQESPTHVKESRHKFSSEILDSGVDCDMSSIELQKFGLLGNISGCSPVKLNFVPIEALITGSKISFTLFEKRFCDSSKILLKGISRNKLDQRAKTRERKLDIEIGSTESEVSPLRTKAFSARNRNKSNMELNDGYEGSEEETSHHEQQESAAPHLRILPLLYICISQPHTFISCQTFKQKVDISCFDLVIKSVSKGFSIKESEVRQLPRPDDYTSSWLETRPGEPDNKTGIPPALILISATNFLHKPISLHADIGRPFRICISESKIEQINHVLTRISGVYFEHKITRTADQNFEIKPCKSQLFSFVDKLRSYSAYIERISLSTNQISVNIEVIKPDKSRSELLGRITSINFSCSTVRKRFSKIINMDEKITDVNVKMDLNGLQLKTVYHSLDIRMLMQPLKFGVEVKISWLTWRKSPYFEFKFTSEVLKLEIGPENILCVSDMIKYFESAFDLESRSKPESTPEKSISSVEETSFTDLTYLDDLRSGVFQYDIKIISDEMCFEPYEVVFDKAAGMMVWCYPEPRALTRVDIHPLPFIAASEKSSIDDLEDKEVSCVLQYFDNLVMSFVTYKEFQLSESKFCQLDLPGINERRLLIVSTTWRVLLDHDVRQETPCGRQVLSPEALAACMRVDSLFSVGILPTIQVLVVFNKSEISLVSHMKLTGKKSAPIVDGYFGDNNYPTEQIFLKSNIDNFSVRSYFYDSGLQIKLNGTAGFEVLNFKYLTHNIVLEPAIIGGTMSIYEADGSDKPRCFILEALGNSIYFHLCQSTIYTLSIASMCWQQAFKIVPDSFKGPVISIQDSLPSIIMTNFLVFNKTSETLRFGQINTDEDIVLLPGQYNMYAWRSHKGNLKLKICIESSKWKWTNPISIEREGNQVSVLYLLKI